MEKEEFPAKDRAEGILLGLAAGDRNGGPIRMAVRLAESLGECGLRGELFSIRDPVGYR